MLASLYPDDEAFIVRGDDELHLKIETYSIVLLALIRLSEPVILRSIGESLKVVANRIACKRLCKKRAIQEKEYGDDSLFAFLNSQLNVEYVYLILQGICHIMKDESLKQQKRQLLMPSLNRNDSRYTTNTSKTSYSGTSSMWSKSTFKSDPG